MDYIEQGHPEDHGHSSDVLSSYMPWQRIDGENQRNDRRTEVCCISIHGDLTRLSVDLVVYRLGEIWYMYWEIIGRQSEG